MVPLAASESSLGLGPAAPRRQPTDRKQHQLARRPRQPIEPSHDGHVALLRHCASPDGFPWEEAGAVDWIDAKSIAKVMAMRAAQGSIIELEAQGADASAAIDSLTTLIAKDFPDTAR
jgi:hypothetical protein